MPPPYSAGSVILQVVPSFEGIQDAIRDEAKKYGALFGKHFDEAFAKETKDGLGKAVDEGLKSATDSAAKAGARAGKAYSRNLGREAGQDASREIGKALARTERESERAGQRAGKRYGGKFAETVKRALSQAQAQIDSIKIDADADPALAALAQVRAAMTALRDAKIGVDLDAADAVATIGALEALLDVMQKDARDIQVRVNAAQAMQELATVRAMVEHLDDLAKNAEVKQNRQLGSFEQLLKSKIEAALRDLPPVDLQADPSDVNQKIAAIRRELFALGDAEININMSADEALIRLRTLLRELEQLDSESADVSVRVDAGAAYRELAAVFGIVEALEAQDVDIDVDVDGAGATAQLRAIQREKRRTEGASLDGANAFRAFNMRVLGFVTLGPALIPLLGGATAGLLAVGTAGFVGAAGLGVAAIGLSGISDAVKALNDVETNAAKDAAAAAKTMRTARNGVRDAEIGLMRARRDAAEGAEQASRRVRDAEETLADAQRDSLRAQRDLIRAREQAADQLEDLALRARGGVLAERQAALDLAEAHAEYIAVMNDGSATADEREQIAINLERERLGYEQARLENQRLQEQQSEAARTGVEGTETYQTALERVAGANEAVADAQQGLADAQRDAARAQRDAAESVEDAMRRLTDSQIAYQEALYDTEVLGSSSMQKLNEAMAALSPAGREFALFWHGLRDDFRAMRDEVQAGFLPGLQFGIASFLDSTGPQLLEYLGVTGEALGDLSSRAGVAFASEEWQHFFDLMTQYTPIFLDQFGTIFGNIIEGFRNIMVASFGFTEEFGDGLIGVTQAWADWTAGFADPDSGFQGFLSWVREHGPDLWDFVVSLARAIWDVAVAVEPYASALLDFLDGILDLISWMDPAVLGAIVVGVLGLTIAWQMATGAIAMFIAVSQLWAAGGAGLIIFGIIALVAAIAILWQNSETFRDIVTGVIDAVVAAWNWLVDVFQTYVMPIVTTVLGAIGDFFSWLWRDIIEPILGVWQVAWGVLWDFVQDAWNRVGQPVFELIWSIVQDLWEIVGPILTLLGMAFQGLWWLVSEAWEHVGKPIFDAFIEVVTWLWENVIGPVLGLIVDRWEWLFGIIKSTWETVGKPIFDLFQAVVEGLVGIFEGSFDGIKAIWEALLDVLMSPIVFVVETVLNKGLIAGINWIAGIFTDDEQWIDPIPTDWIPGRAFGGPIPMMGGGRVPGSSPHKRADNVPVMATAGEFMHDVDATSYYGMPLMHAINERQIPREALYSALYGLPVQERAYGGLIDPMWDWIKQRFPAARLNSHYRAGDPGYHGRRQAIDLGEVGFAGGQGRPLMADMKAAIFQAFPEVGELIYNGLGNRVPNKKNGRVFPYSRATQLEHMNHLHWAMRSLADFLAGGGAGITKFGIQQESIWGKIADFFAGPVDFLKGIVTKWAGNSLGSDMGQMLLNIPMDFAENAADVLLEFVSGQDTETVLQEGTEVDSNVRFAVQQLAASKGWGSGVQWDALAKLIQRESSWNPRAKNPSSTASGLFQHINATWRAHRTAGASQYGSMRDAPIHEQVIAGLSYIEDRYGSPAAAWRYWQAHNHYADGGPIEPTLYDEGGYLPPGVSMVLNATGQPEPVLTADELEMLRNGAGLNGGGDIWDVDIHEAGADAEQIVGAMMHAVRVERRRGRYGEE